MIPTKKDKLPNTFDKFKQVYLNDDGTFKTNMKKSFQNKVAGLISYLDRTKDPTQFSQAYFRKVSVPLSTNTIIDYDQKINSYKKLIEKSKEEFNAKKKQYSSEIRKIKSANKSKRKKKKSGGYKKTPKKSGRIDIIQKLRTIPVKKSRRLVRKFRKFRKLSKQSVRNIISKSLKNIYKGNLSIKKKDLKSLIKNRDRAKAMFNSFKKIMSKKIKSLRKLKRLQKKSFTQSHRLKNFCKLNL